MKGTSARKSRALFRISLNNKGTLNLFRSNYLYSSLTHIFLFSICFNAHFRIFPSRGINEKRWSRYVLPHTANFHLSEPWYALVLQPLKHFFTEFREEICHGFDFIYSSLHVVVIFYISVSQNSPAKRLVGSFLKKILQSRMLIQV